MSDERSQGVPTGSPADDGAEPGLAERRRAVQRLGVMAAWTAPAMVTLLMSKRASAESAVPDPPSTF